MERIYIRIILFFSGRIHVKFELVIFQSLINYEWFIQKILYLFFIDAVV